MNWKETQRKHFISGLSRALDVGSTYARAEVHQGSFASDKKAMASDWKSIGRDLKTARRKINE